VKIVDEAPRQGLLATITDRAVLTLLDSTSDPLSRSEIAGLSGLSKPAISDAARRLEEAGVIRPTGTRGGRRGGVATLYEINANRGHSVALAVNSEAVSARALRLDGSVGAVASELLSDDADRGSVIAATNRVLGSVEAECTTPLLAAAVSLADPIDPASGRVVEVIDSVFPAGHFDVIDWLPALGTNVAVDNDVNWASIAERHVGSMRLIDDFVYVYIGAGLGAGLFLGGQIQRGARGLAGEIGHLRAAKEGDDLTRSLARLGWGDSSARYGLDVGAATTALEAAVLSPESVRALELLAVAIANIVTLLNSRAVVLGGPIGTLHSVVEHLSRALPELVPDAVDVVLGQCTPLDGASFEALRMAKSGVGF